MPGEGWVDATSVRKLVISRPTVRLVQKRELLVDTRIPKARKACVYESAKSKFQLYRFG